MKTLVNEVNLGSQARASGIERVGKAITRMEQVKQKMAINVGWRRAARRIERRHV